MLDDHTDAAAAHAEQPLWSICVAAKYNVIKSMVNNRFCIVKLCNERCPRLSLPQAPTKGDSGSASPVPLQPPTGASLATTAAPRRAAVATAGKTGTPSQPLPSPLPPSHPSTTLPRPLATPAVLSADRVDLASPPQPLALGGGIGRGRWWPRSPADLAVRPASRAGPGSPRLDLAHPP